jgi:hypothetical protein
VTRQNLFRSNDFESRLIPSMSFRFTIRDLLWLTVVVAVLVAWWVDRRSKNAELQMYQGKLEFGTLPVPEPTPQ